MRVAGHRGRVTSPPDGDSIRLKTAARTQDQIRSGFKQSAHVLAAFRGKSVTSVGSATVPSSPVSHTAQLRAFLSVAVLCLGPDLDAEDAVLATSSVILRARHELAMGHVEHEGLLTVQTVAPSSIRACRGRRESQYPCSEIIVLGGSTYHSRQNT